MSCRERCGRFTLRRGWRTWSIGAAGLSDAVLAELDRALDSHELVKLRIAADDRVQRKALVEDLCRRAQAELIQRIGHTAVIYRKRPED